MHYSLWKNYMKTFRGYWLHGNNVREINDGKITINEFLTHTMNIISL
jgi:hypothetical protein